MNIKDLNELSDEEFEKLLKEWFTDKDIAEMFKNVNLKPDDEEKESENKKNLYEMPDEEFVKLVKEFIADVGIEKMFKNANLTQDKEEKEDIINKNERNE